MRGWLLTGLERGDRDAQIRRAWIAAQDVRLHYAATDRIRAAQRLHRWLTYCANTDIAQLHLLARTIDAWRQEPLTDFDTRRRLQRLTEATSLPIKKGETVRPPWIPQCEPTHARQRSSRPNRTASSNASQDASMMFGCTPTVVHSVLLSDVSMSTRVVASVPCLPGRMRTL